MHLISPENNATNTTSMSGNISSAEICFDQLLTHEFCEI